MRSTIVVKWIVLVISLTSPPPTVVTLDNGPTCQGGYAVESSWCTEQRTVPYECVESDVRDIPQSEYAILTENNFTGSSKSIRLKHKRVVNVSLGLLEKYLPDPFVLYLSPPLNFYFSRVHVGEVYYDIYDPLGAAGFRLGSSAESDIFDSAYYLLSYFWYSVESTNWTDLSSAGELRLVFAPETIGMVKTTFLFESTSIPNNQLQVFCQADKKGYIQTHDWDGVNKYPTYCKSCVTIEIPANHTVMVSLVALEIAQDDELNVYQTANCQGSGYKIAELKQFEPTVYDTTTAISVSFISNPDEAYSGFRFLYSFHPKSKQPTKLSDEKWNCSVPFWSDFQEHFMCTSQVFCSSERDAVVGCITNEFCGTTRNVAQWELGGYCYRMFSPKKSEGYSWIEASKKCESLRGHLVNLNSEAKRLFFGSITSTDGRDIIYVGFKLSTVSNMYKYTRMWTDQTLAIYLQINTSNSFETCGYSSKGHGSYLSTTLCKEKKPASFLCEDVGGRGETYAISNASPPTIAALPSSTLPSGKARCKHNHIAHDFLACDIDTNCSAVDIVTSQACADREDPAIPFFTCRSNSQPLPYSLVCDHRADCCDSSDEDFCVFPECKRNEFICLKNRQCIPAQKLCNRYSDCFDDSDESACDVTEDEIQKNTVLPPARVDFTGHGDFVVTPLNSSDQCPDTHFRCPGNDSYCMPVYVRCNRVYDCHGKEDELGCDAYTCPGFYRCRGSTICLHYDHLCDRVAQCPQRDDELMCNATCPERCTCYGYAFICTGEFSPNMQPELRYLKAPGTNMTLNDFSNNRYLIHLGMQNCGIKNIGTMYLPNLQSLDLSYNSLSGADFGDLNSLTNLRVLSLAHNPLIKLMDLFDRLRPLPLITSVNFAGISLQEWPDNFSVIFPNVQKVDLSDSGLDRLSKSGFQSLSKLRSLNVSECPLRTFFPGVFNDLSDLKEVFSGNYKLCCPAVSPGTSFQCTTQTDEISSCDALLRTEAFRVFLTLYAILSLLGNFGSFVYRSIVDKKAVKLGFDVFVTHLCVADFLMGVYLAIIGVADRIYYGSYVWNDGIWRESTACKVAGFLSLLSSEVSAFLNYLITLERVLVITFPFKRLCFSRQMAHVTCCILWLVGLLLAAIPLTQDWEFYGQSSICVPLPITRQDFDGMNYAFGVMVGFNFVLFVLIAIGQMLIYRSIRANSMSAKFTSKKSNDTAIARRLLAVVMTDFLCWFPIGLLGILARLNVPISGEINVVMAVFVLPFNSALNPFLYTFNMLMERRHKARSSRSSKTSEQKTVVETMETESKTCTEDEAWKQLDTWLNGGVLSLDRLRHRVIDMDNVHT